MASRRCALEGCRVDIWGCALDEDGLAGRRCTLEGVGLASRLASRKCYLDGGGLAGGR